MARLRSPPPLRGRPPPQGGRCLRSSLQQSDHDPSRGNIHRRHVGLIERHQFRIAAGVGPHLDQIAGAEIVDRDHRAERFAGAVDDSKANQVGVVKLVYLLGLRQAVTRHVEPDVRQPLGGFAVAYPRQRRHKVILGRPQRRDLENATVLRFERAIIDDRRRVGRKRAQPHFAAYAIRSPELPEANSPG